MSTRTNWILMVATLAAAAWGFTGCTAHATAPEVETVGQLAAGPSIWHAPVHETSAAPTVEIAGSAEDDAGDTVTTTTRVDVTGARKFPESFPDAGSDDAAPEVTNKGAGLTLGGVRQ